MINMHRSTALVSSSRGAKPAARPFNPANFAGAKARRADWRLRLAPGAMLALALIGIADASYVAWGSYTGQTLWCVFFDGCNAVAQSPYARILGVPISFVGVLFYVHMAALAAVLAADPESRGLRAAALIYAAAGVGFSAYAMYLQVSLIRAACSYCLISALVTLALLTAAIWHARIPRTGVPAAAG